MSTKSKQLRKTESEIILLQAIIEDLDAHRARLSTQVAEACQEVALAQDKLAEARRDVIVAREAARAIEDAVTIAVDNA